MSKFLEKLIKKVHWIITLLLILTSFSNAGELKQLSSLLNNKGKYFGSAILWRKLANDTTYRKNVAAFSMATPETEMKLFYVQKTRGIYDFSDADSIVSFCKNNNILVRGHTLVYSVKERPQWLTANDFSKDTLWKILHVYVSTVAKHFEGKLYCWDVVNEAIDNNGKMVPNKFYKALGETYIDSAFIWTHIADPKVKLFYNDYYSNYSHDEYKKKLDLTYKLLSRLKNSGIKVDGIGLQMHQSIDKTIDYGYFKTYLDKFAELGLEIHFTELDVAIDTPFTISKFQEQAKVYKDVVSLFVSVPACKSLIVWGFTDTTSWIPAYSKGKKGAACLLDAHYQPKPAFDTILQYLKK